MTGADPRSTGLTVRPRETSPHPAPYRDVAAALGVPVVWSLERAVFGPVTLVAEYIPAGRGGPRVVLYTEGVARTAEQQDLPPCVVEQRAIAHELLHHAAASAPPGAKKVPRGVL